MAYADVADVETLLMREFGETEKARVNYLLGYASAMLNGYLHITEEDVEAGSVLAENLRLVCTNMAARVVSNGTLDTLGVSQTTISADIYSQTYTYSNPSGDMYLTKAEKRLLGIGGGYIGSIRPKIGAKND